MERSHCLQQADTQEEQMEERGQLRARLFSLLCLYDMFFFKNMIKSQPPVLFFVVFCWMTVIVFPSRFGKMLNPLRLHAVVLFSPFSAVYRWGI